MIAVLKPIDSSRWTRQSARHLLNRAGLGVPYSAIDALHRLGPEKAVDTFLQCEQFDRDLKEPNWLNDPASFREMRRMFEGKDEEERRMMRRELRMNERQAIEKLKLWWLLRMKDTPRPLEEKMALFWHGHFATSAQKVRGSYFNYDLNRLFREHGLGDFENLVTQVSQSPAMLRYLDNRVNFKNHPNENFARELLELFTLGIGHYTETDIKEAARAFSGWTVRGGRFFFNARRHDDGVKTFMGRKGRFSGYNIIKILCEQPALPEFISRKLWEFFVYEEPSEQIVDSLAEVFLSNRLQIKPLLQTIFLSREFYSERAVGGQIKSPAQLMVGLLDSIPLDDEQLREREVNRAMRAMGQDLFYPPNVKGWDGNRAWINTNTLLARYNIPSMLLNGRIGHSDRFRQVLSMRYDPERTKKEEAVYERQRKRILDRIHRQALADRETLWRQYSGRKAGEVVDELVERLLSRSLEADQRTVLVKALARNGNENDILSDRNSGESYLAGAIHLITSMSEYQLC